MTKLSVLISCYNQSSIITETLMPLIKFSSQQIEVIIFDDFSSDNSYDIVSKFSSEYDNFYSFRMSKNSGISKVRNLLLSKASGEYFCFIDGDDPQSYDYYKSILEEIMTCKEVYQINYFKHIHDDFTKMYTNTCLINSVLYVISSKNKDALYFDETLDWGEDFEFWIRNNQLLCQEINYIKTAYDYNRKASNASVTKQKSVLKKYHDEKKLLIKINKYESKNKKVNQMINHKKVNQMINHKKVDILVLEVLLKEQTNNYNVSISSISVKFKLLYLFIKLCPSLGLSKFRYKLIFKKYNQI